MNASAITATRFRRGPDQRFAEDAGDCLPERRCLGLDWIPLFQGANEQALKDTLGDCDVLLLPAGTPLLKTGEPNHNVYIVLSGRVVAHLDVVMNPDAAISIAPGECVGELSAIDGKPVSALVIALSDARVLMLTREVFWHQLMRMPDMAERLMIILSERMRRSNELALKAQREQLELLHLRKELDVARQLQLSMLPLQRPIFPERSDIEVCGFMEPAEKVGGDFFDVFFVDEHTLFFCVGDVSGHGVPAALFMARTIGLLRILAASGLAPDRLLSDINQRLCDGNETNLFVTLFCGFLDLRSGLLRYSNGGHCAPLVAQGGKAGFLPIPKGPLIGAFNEAQYLAFERCLLPGEVFYCYTDGVTEAQNAHEEEFGDERCAQVLASLDSLPLPEMLDRIRSHLAGFCDSDRLDDDCTMLSVRRR